MSRERLTVGPDGVIRDRAGETLGTLVSFVFDLDVVRPGTEGKGGDIGGVGVSSPPASSISSEAVEKRNPQEGGVGGTKSVDRIWAEYQRIIPGASRQTLDATKRRVIQNARQVRSEERCIEAIVGLSKSPHHNGENEQRKKYLGIRYALKGNSAKGESNDERIDKMAEIASSAANDLLSGIPSAGREMVRTRQRLVEDMLRNPGDSTRRSRGGDSERYLQETFGLRAYLDGQGKVCWVRELGGGR